MKKLIIILLLVASSFELYTSYTERKGLERELDVATQERLEKEKYYEEIITGNKIQNEETIGLLNETVLSLNKEIDSLKKKLEQLKKAEAKRVEKQKAEAERVAQEEIALQEISIQSNVTNAPVDDNWHKVNRRHVESSNNYNTFTENGYLGAYQFAPVTWNDIAQRHGLNPNDFSPANQDRFADIYATERWGGWANVPVTGGW